MKYLIANWKAQMTLPDMVKWVEDFRSLLHGDQIVREKLENEQLRIIICPPFPYLLYIKNRFEDTQGISVGAQTVSHVEHGKFTGEVTTEALKDVVGFSIIGHSERRTHFHESNEDIGKQASLCQQNEIEPILCIRNKDDEVNENVAIVAYEPVEAIGSGENADPKEVLRMKTELNLESNITFLYGGSADSNNIEEYLETKEVDGFLVGTASLDAKEFFKMAEKM